MVKTWVSFISSMFIVITAGASFAAEPELTEVEPNNRPAQANPIRLDQTVIGIFHYGDYDAGDYYSLTAPGKGKMTATVVLASPDCMFKVGAMGFHGNRGETDWVPSPAWIDGKSPVRFSFPVESGRKGYILISGPQPIGGSFSGGNWSTSACTKGGDFYLTPTANQQPRDVPASWDGRRVLPPLQYRLIVTFAGEGAADMGKPPIVVPLQPPIVTPPPPPQPPIVTPPPPPQAAERILIEAENEMESSIRPLSERPSRNAKEIHPAWRPPYSGSGDWYLAVGGEFLRYQFNVNRGGMYYVWVRDYVDRFQPKGVRRIIVEFDGRPYGAFSEVDIPAPGDKGAFGWHRVGNGVNLTTGTHTMKVTKEATTAGAAILDAFYLTTDPNDRPAEK